jgi:hypothetical protein
LHSIAKKTSISRSVSGIGKEEGAARAGVEEERFIGEEAADDGAG